MRQGNTRRLIPILILVVAAVWVVMPNNPGIHVGRVNRDIRIVRGLDLQGGLRVLLEADLPEETEVTTEQLQTARDIIEKRVNGLGVTEPVVQVAGSRRILVELPGIGDPQEAVETIQQTSLLEFVELGPVESLQPGLVQGQEIKTDFGTQSQGENPVEGDLVAGEELSETDAADIVYHTVMTGAQLKDAYVARDKIGNFTVAFELTDEGADLFAAYTEAHIGDVLAIVMDKVIISAPRIETKIPDGMGNITGNFDAESANNLAVQLRFGALPIPLSVAESKTVGPTLGQDSLDKSTQAGVIGMAIVMLFMALYYRLPGVLADIALVFYTVITFALFKLIPVTLTLPGVAGFVLSIGVAVDANVLIFERMKEELRNGKSLHQAIDLGFSRAWPSIRDSNLSTLITCAILFWFGNTFGASIVKGFSVTLALGVLVSLFTAITVTRTFLHAVLDNIGLRDHPRWFGI